MKKRLREFLRQNIGGCPNPPNHQSRANDGRTTGGKHDYNNVQPQVTKLTKPGKKTRLLKKPI
jgi:hypothetical protein